jgi:hypothetical protein
MKSKKKARGMHDRDLDWRGCPFPMTPEESARFKAEQAEENRQARIPEACNPRSLELLRETFRVNALNEGRTYWIGRVQAQLASTGDRAPAVMKADRLRANVFGEPA